MVKRKYAIFFVSIILAIIIACPTYANNSDWTRYANESNTYLRTVVSNDHVSRVIGSARGRLLSSSGLEISNDNDGIIGVYAETLCHVGVAEINMVIYLDVWDEIQEDWVMVNEYDYNWLAEDSPNGELTDVSVSFDVVGLQKGRTYSLRAYHAARSFDNYSETMATETGGIVLE